MHVFINIGIGMLAHILVVKDKEYCAYTNTFICFDFE
jgi:hypothetical protein